MLFTVLRIARQNCTGHLANQLAMPHDWRTPCLTLNLEPYFRTHKADNKKPIRIGIGIHSGTAINGNTGHSRRREFTQLLTELRDNPILERFGLS